MNGVQGMAVASPDVDVVWRHRVTGCGTLPSQMGSESHNLGIVVGHVGHKTIMQLSW